MLLVTYLSCQQAKAQINQQQVPDKTRILFLLDGSGSMLAHWENSTRIMVAKRLLSDLVDSVKINTDVELALRVYGHQYDKRYQNCKDTKLEVGFSSDNHEIIKKTLMQLKPQGTTPIAYSLQQAADDFPDEPDVRNIIIIITDGLESCGGDPCDVSLALQKKRVFLKPFVIGIGMNENYEKQFACLGQFFDARNIAEFRNVLNLALKQTLDKTTVSVELLDIDNAPNETNVNVTFVNNVTGEPEYNFVHYRDRNGHPDSVEIDAVLTYDLVVNTIPPVYKRNVNINAGEHNIIPVKVPQGELWLKQKGYTEYDKGVKAIIRKSGQFETVHIHQIPEKEKYLVGNYDLEVLTLPKIYLADITINPNTVTEIEIPPPGVLNISTSIGGYGGLYQVKENGRQVWVYNLDSDKSRHAFAVQPGKYQIVYRAKNASGSKYTEIKEFTIKSGSTTQIKLFGR